MLFSLYKRVIVTIVSIEGEQEQEEEKKNEEIGSHSYIGVLFKSEG
jgi:hypothetical protein